MELTELLDDVGQVGSLRAEERVAELLTRLDLQREELRRTIANNFLEAGRAGAARAVLTPLVDSRALETQLLLGEVAAAEGRSDEARTRFERALDIDPGSGTARANMGILALTAGRLPEAARWFEEAVEHAPGEAAAWNGLGVIRAQGGDLRGAVAAWDRAVKADPSMSDAWFNLAMAHRGLGDTEAARSALRRHAELAQGPERERALGLLAQLGG
jgi:Flp pilus assembly protein TadD